MKFIQDKLNRQQSKLLLTKHKAGLAQGQIEAVLSTDDLDRHGERVSINGLSVPKNQTIKMYYNHETNGANLPIGKWDKVWKSEDGKLLGRGQFDLNDPFASMVYQKVQNGFIDSISIGFYPQEFDGETSTWTQSTLVEASIVAEPANVNAVITAKTLGFTQDEFNKTLKVKLKSVSDVPEEPEAPEEIEPIVEDKDLDDVFVGEPGTPPEPSNEDGVTATELKAAFEELESKFGALEAAVKASIEKPAMKKLLIKARTAGKEVDKTAEELNKVLRVTLKGHDNV